MITLDMFKLYFILCLSLVSEGTGFVVISKVDTSVSLNLFLPQNSLHRLLGPPTSIPLTRLSMFGKLFGGGDSEALKLDVDGMATLYTSEGTMDQVEYDGLSEYIQQWSNLFVTGGISLTTPVEVTSIERPNAVGIRLLFQSIDTGYKSKSEEDEQRDGSNEKDSKKAASQGGLDIFVEKSADGLVSVLVQRCEIDEDTIIKEMSEETILKELKEALGVWKRDRKSG